VKPIPQPVLAIHESSSSLPGIEDDANNEKLLTQLTLLLESSASCGAGYPRANYG